MGEKFSFSFYRYTMLTKKATYEMRNFSGLLRWWDGGGGLFANYFSVYP